MSSVKKIISGLFVLYMVVIFFQSQEAFASNSPMQTLKSAVQRVIDILKDPELKKAAQEVRRKAIKEAVSDVFDFKEMSRRTLGIHWRKLTAQQQKEFVVLFSRLLENTYISKIEGYTDEEIVYLDEIIKTRYALVKTVIKTSRGTEIPIYYKMIKKNNKWMVYDVIIEGVSLVRNYRSQFSRILLKESVESLFQKLRAKVQKK